MRTLAPVGERTADVIVVGLGAMGTAALCQLAGRGLSARGFDQFDIPNTEGSSHGGSRVIRKAYFEDPRYVPLVLRAYQLWEELAEGVRETLFVRTGGVHIGPPDHPVIRGVEEAARQHRLAHERLDAVALRARFPVFAPADDSVGIFEEETGLLSPERCVAAHAITAVRAGATIHGRERVIAVEPGGESVVVSTDRDRYEAGAVVIATGAWLAAADSPVRVAVPLEVERQVQCWFQPKQPSLFDVGAMPVFVHVEGDAVFYGAPRWENPGVKVCRHHGGDVTTADEIAREPTREDEQLVRSFVQARLPAADGPLVAARVCMYTNTPDDRFVVGAHPDHSGVFVAGGFSGHGFKFAPVIGEVIADMVTAGATRHEVSFFDPGRAQM